MLESIIVMFQKTYLILGVLAILCIFGIWGRNSFLFNIFFSSGLSMMFGWTTWYVDNGDWWRTGKPMEGTAAYILGYLGWLLFLTLVFLLSSLKVYLGVRLDGLDWSAGVFQELFWVSWTMFLFNEACRHFCIIQEIPCMLEISCIGVILYPVVWIARKVYHLLCKFRRWWRKFIYRCRVKRYQKQS